MRVIYLLGVMTLFFGCQKTMKVEPEVLYKTLEQYPTIDEIRKIENNIVKIAYSVTIVWDTATIYYSLEDKSVLPDYKDKKRKFDYVEKYDELAVKMNKNRGYTCDFTISDSDGTLLSGKTANYAYYIEDKKYIYHLNTLFELPVSMLLKKTEIKSGNVIFQKKFSNVFESTSWLIEEVGDNIFVSDRMRFHAIVDKRTGKIKRRILNDSSRYSGKYLPGINKLLFNGNRTVKMFDVEGDSVSWSREAGYVVDVEPQLYKDKIVVPKGSKLLFYDLDGSLFHKVDVSIERKKFKRELFKIYGDFLFFDTFNIIGVIDLREVMPSGKNT
jgi:hypothetical protein